MLSTKQVRLKSAICASFEKQSTVSMWWSVPMPKFSKPSHLRTHSLPSPFPLPDFSPELPQFCQQWEDDTDDLKKKKKKTVQIVGAACGSSPAEANVWNVTDFSRWASVGRSQLHTKCPFLEIQASGGLFSCTGSNSRCKGQESQLREKAPRHRPIVVSFFVATYNDFIKKCMQPLSLLWNGLPCIKEKLRK